MTRGQGVTNAATGPPPEVLSQLFDASTILEVT